MRLHKFSDVDAFVALDLDGAEAASGPVRWARKILQGGAKDLARSQTYTYAALQMRRSGASAGINAETPGRGEAVAAFVAEAAALVADGTYLPDAAKGVGEDDLAPLRDGDARNVGRLGAFAAASDAVSAATAAEAAVGLDGATAVIEGLSATGTALAIEVDARGGRVVAASSAEGTLTASGGLDTAALAEAWTDHGDRALSALAGSDDGLDPAGALWGTPADVVFAGSKMGVVHHGVAEQLECRALVPSGRLAFTSKALAVCRRRGIAAVPDFVALTGSAIAAWSSPDTSDDDVRDEVIRATTALVVEVLGADDGPFLGACYAAEAFLSTWQDELPFGRPLAS